MTQMNEQEESSQELKRAPPSRQTLHQVTKKDPNYLFRGSDRANMSSVGPDEIISGTKLEPLESNDKKHDTSDSGVTGSDIDIDRSRIDPLGGAGQGQHTAPHADSQGVIGRDNTIQGAKLEPLKSSTSSETSAAQGLDDEAVDAARIDPMGSVREGTPPV